MFSILLYDALREGGFLNGILRSYYLGGGNVALWPTQNLSDSIAIIEENEVMCPKSRV